MCTHTDVCTFSAVQCKQRFKMKDSCKYTSNSKMYFSHLPHMNSQYVYGNVKNHVIRFVQFMMRFGGILGSCF